MKRTMKIITLATIVAMTSITAFGQEAKKAAEARKDISRARIELRQAKIDSAADYKKFKKEAGLKIEENQKEIIALKAKKAHDSNKVKMKYDKEVGELEKKNSDLKSKMASADFTETSKWTSFKHDFNREMSELGHSIKDLTTRNQKK
jgi:hypothetical protein